MNKDLLDNYIRFNLKEFSNDFYIIQKGNPCLFSLENKKYSAHISYIHDSGKGRTNDDETRIQIGRDQIDWQLDKKNKGYITCYLGFFPQGDVLTAWDPDKVESFQGKKRTSEYTRFSLYSDAIKNVINFYTQKSNRQKKMVRHPVMQSNVLGLYLQNIDVFHNYDSKITQENQKDNIRALIKGNLDLTNDLNSNISSKQELQTSREKKTIVCKRTSYSRDPQFTKNVINAYENKCAICNIQLGIIEAAHIIPHALPESSDKVDNGIALCRNHHKLFDNGLIILDLDQKIFINKNVKDFLDQADLLHGFEKLESEISKGYSVPDDSKLQPSRENIIFGKKYRLSQ
jgi:putative restriction endonuclease